MRLHKIVAFVLVVAMLTVTLGAYPVQAHALSEHTSLEETAADETPQEEPEEAPPTEEEPPAEEEPLEDETEEPAQTTYTQLLGEMDAELESNSTVETTAGYTHIDIDDLTSGTQGMTDTDEDGLADDVEKVLGTDPELADTDQDNLDDYYEATHGLDPLYPDTNRDGLADYYEILLSGSGNGEEMTDDDVDSDLDTDGDGTRNADDMDNDGDGVIDGVDISPFSYGEASDEYVIDIETSGEATYVNVQIRPEDAQKMYENNQIYDWPYDTEGNIMDSDMTQDDMRMLPMLEVETDNLPSEEECEKYGIMLGNGKMNAMLDPVIDRGQLVAYSAKVFIPAGQTTTSLKLKMAWTLQMQVDNAAHRWEELPSAYGGAKEYISAGAAAADIDGDGHDDVVISGVDDRDGSFFYAVSYNMELDGGSDEFTGMLEVPVGFPEESAGSGVALADINKNGKMDIVCMAVESRSGADRFVYTIGYDLDSNARAKEWTSLMIGPTLGHKNQGGGLSVADLDGNGKFEFVMMAIDNPDGANHFRYTIRWNFDPNAADAYEYNSDEWSALRATGNIGHHNQGGGVEVVNLDGDSKPDLLFTCVDNPDKGNKFWTYAAYDIDVSGSDRGAYSSFNYVSGYSMGLGYNSEGAGVAAGDFDGDGKDDLYIVDVDDPRGSKNAFWYWVGDTLQSDGSVQSFSDKRSMSGVKGGLISSLNKLDDSHFRLNGKALGLDCTVSDLDGNGIDDVHMAWINEENKNIYLTTGWDINEDGQVLGWQNPKNLTYEYTGNSGMGLDFYDVDNDKRDDLIIAYYKAGYILYDTMKQFQWKGHYSYSSSGTRGFAGRMLDLRDEFDGIDNLTWSHIGGIGIDYVDVDGNGKVDVVINYTKSYENYEVTQEEISEQTIFGKQITQHEMRNYYYIRENRVDVLYDVRIPNSINDDYYFSYEDRDRFVLYTYSRTNEDSTDKNFSFHYERRHFGGGMEIIDLNGDDKLDALIAAAPDRGKKGEFYYLIQYDFLSDDSTLQLRKNNDSSNWNYYDIKIRGIGLATCDFDENNTDDGVAIAYDDEEGFRYYKAMNIETKPVPILREYETFELIGLRVEENLGADAGIAHCDLASSEENDRKAMSVFEGLRGHFLKEENDIEAGLQTVEDEYDISGVTLVQESFAHADEVSVYIDDNTGELFEDASGTHVPIIVSITNTSRALTLDAAGSGVIRGAYLSYNLADASSQTTKLLQLQWYNADEDKMVDTEQLANGVDGDWGWDLSDDETKMNAISLLTHWQMGEINMTHIDNSSILPERKLWSAGWWGTTLGGGTASIYKMVNYSRQGYAGLKVVSSIWKYKGGITGFAKNMTNYYKLMNGVRVSDANVWKLKNALDVDTFTGVKGKFASGPKISKLAKWATRAAYAFELGMAVYRGAEIGNAYASEGTGYAVYAGAVYTTLKGGYATALYLIPIVAKLKYGAIGSGVGAIIVALIELSDLITFLACGKSWSTMVIEKIFNALVGTNPDVEVDLNMTSSDMTYSGMENGMYVVKSNIRNQMTFRGTVEDIDDGHYDSKYDIDDNYAKPKVEYESTVDPEFITINNSKKVDKWYRKRSDLWWVYRDYDIDNSITFNNLGMNLPVKSIFNVYYKVHIHKKGPGDDYFEEDSDKSSEKLYFDVLPVKLSEFRECFEFDTNYEGGAEVEPLGESKDRVARNEIVIVDEDGDGLLVCGNYEKNADGEIVYSDPTKVDTDGDGINDNFEDALGSDPSDPDSDNDELNDREEMLRKTDLNDSDSDGDGLTDKEEIDGYTITVNFNGQNLSTVVHSDPLCADTDGDLVEDADEKANGTNPASMYTHGQKRWDGNEYDPEMSQVLPDINDKAIGDSITIDFEDYFTDQDGDNLTYTVDVGDLDGSVWTYTYEGGHVEVTVLAEDGRDGDHEELFIVDDTTCPYMSSTFFYNRARNTDELDGATKVRKYAWMSIEYNEIITFTGAPSAVMLVDEYGANIPVTVDIPVDSTVMTITPTINLTEDYYEYTLTVPHDYIQDQSGNVTEQGYTAVFTTIDTTGPRVTDCNRTLGDTPAAPLPGAQVLGLEDEVTWTFHEPLRDWQRYPVFVGPDENTWTAWDFETTVDEAAGTLTANIKQDVLEDNTYYRLYPRVVDPRGNRCDPGYVGFTTGDVTSPDLLLAPYYVGDPTIKYMMKIDSDVIEIPYDENIFEGVNFDDIVLEEVMAYNLLKPIVSRAAEVFGDPTGLVDSIVESDITTMPIDVQIVGNKLVITPDVPLVPGCMYALVIPSDAVQDVNGYSAHEMEEVHITFDDSNKPEVYASGFTTFGRVDTEKFGTIKNTFGNIAVVFNEGVKKTAHDSLDQVTLVDSQGNDVSIETRIEVWYDEIYGAGIGQVITIDARGNLKENETYTLTMPAGTVENILGFDNAEFIETYTPTSTSIPGVEDSTFGIVGVPRVDEKVYVHYMYERYKETFERVTDFQWYRGSTFEGEDKQAIPGATMLAYRITEADMHKYLFCEITITLLDGTVLPSVMTPGIGPIGGPHDPNNDLELLEARDAGDVVFSKYNPGENEYETLVDSDVREVDLTALPEADAVHVQIYTDDLEESEETGTEATVPLWFGENQVTVTVTDERGTSDQVYTLSIERDRTNEHLFPPEGYCEIRPDVYTESGKVYADTLLYGDTYYYDDEKRSEGESEYRWYRSDSKSGSGKTLVSEEQDYTPASSDKGYYIFFEYTAVTNSGIEAEPYLSEPVKVSGGSASDDEVAPSSAFETPDDAAEATQGAQTPDGETAPDTGEDAAGDTPDSAADDTGGAAADDADDNAQGGGWIWYAIGGAVLLLLAGGAGAYLLIRRRRRMALDAADEEAVGEDAEE